MRQNLHTHTFRCRHASGTEEEYVLAAIENGFDFLGFSDHAPMPFEGSYYSTMRMRPEELGSYCDAVLALKEKYASKIEIRLGLEAEYYPGVFSRFRSLIRDYPIEYLILGQHFLYDEVGCPYTGHATDSEEYLKQYVSQTIEGFRTGCFLYLAHPDLINFTGDRELYLSEMERLCRAAKDAGVVLEFNVNGAQDNRNYPNPDFWKLAGEIGNTAVIGYDAHRKDAFTWEDAYQRCVSLAKSSGVRLLDRIDIPKMDF